jgi:hypothetical protein
VFLLHRSLSETLRIIDEGYGKAAMKKKQVYKWHKGFRDGRANVNDDPHSGRPSTSTNNENMERVGNVVRDDRQKEHSKDVITSRNIRMYSLHKGWKMQCL